MPKITKRVVDAAEPRESEYHEWDSELKGFGLRVRPSGAKSYVLMYRPTGQGRTAPSRRVTLGAVGKLTPDEARLAAKRLLGDVAHGGDPATERAQEKKAATVAELADLFLAEHVAVKRKATTEVKYRHVIESIIVPAFGRMKPNAVTRAAVAKMHHANADRPTIANYALAVLASMFTFGQARGLVTEDVNPTRHIEKFKENKRERFLTAEELGRVGDALREAEGEGIPWRGTPTDGETAKHRPREENCVSRFDPAAVAAVRLLLLTGCRLREILHLRWAEIDFERGLLFLGDSKTGAKTVTLNAAALELLQALPRRGTYVIPGANPDAPRSDLKRLWAAVTARAKLGNVRLHDLRHTYASIGVGGGQSLHVVGKLLGHTQAATTHRYAHLAADPLRKAANEIGDAISGAIAGDIEQERK